MSTILIKAIENGSFDDAYRIIEDNQNDIVNIVDKDGIAPIHLTTDHSMYDDLTSHETTELNKLTIALVQAGANVTLPYEGMLPIHYLSFQIQPSLEVFKSLLLSDDHLNLKDAANCTPLHYLVERESWHVVDFIIQRGVHIELPENFEGKSPIDLLSRHAQEYKAKLLKLALKITGDIALSNQNVSFLPSKSQARKIPESEILWLKENAKLFLPKNNKRNRQPPARFKP